MCPCADKEHRGAGRTGAEEPRPRGREGQQRRARLREGGTAKTQHTRDFCRCEFMSERASQRAHESKQSTRMWAAGRVCGRAAGVGVTPPPPAAPPGRCRRAPPDWPPSSRGCCTARKSDRSTRHMARVRVRFGCGRQSSAVWGWGKRKTGSGVRSGLPAMECAVDALRGCVRSAAVRKARAAAGP